MKVIIVKRKPQLVAVRRSGGNCSDCCLPHTKKKDKLHRYGPVVKEHYLWNFPLVHLYDKQDIEQVFKFSTKFPIRPPLEAQVHYRRSCPARYASVGLVNA